MIVKGLLSTLLVMLCVTLTQAAANETGLAKKGRITIKTSKGNYQPEFFLAQADYNVIAKGRVLTTLQYPEIPEVVVLARCELSWFYGKDSKILVPALCFSRGVGKTPESQGMNVRNWQVREDGNGKRPFELGRWYVFGAKGIRSTKGDVDFESVLPHIIFVVALEPTFKWRKTPTLGPTVDATSLESLEYRQRLAHGHQAQWDIRHRDNGFVFERAVFQKKHEAPVDAVTLDKILYALNTLEWSVVKGADKQWFEKWQADAIYEIAIHLHTKGLEQTIKLPSVRGVLFYLDPRGTVLEATSPLLLYETIAGLEKAEKEVIPPPEEPPAP